MTNAEKYGKIISTCCYIRDNGKVLMLYRNKTDSHFHKRVYRGIGGKAEQGENPVDCVKREVKEEAGIDIQPVWRGIVTFSNPSKNDWEAHIFVADGFKGDLIECNEGELEWINENDVINLDMPEGDRKLIPYLFNEEKFQAHFTYGEDKNLIEWRIDNL